ncbi:uncharacterized protein EDB93DRAFT_876322 [Suillus bovinus]|uniref:uncharacterized protein n=1 Tax=Suillus bovinus TaxID=48563 RepID=UPI001B872A89|nr:uncharacterized protein EDB93DRAFT_876322 [Suillus bovinus]KAG2156920.1 hypothetical protein EDB93DRAFT_876322 [Suillus bovinus]
MRAKRRQMTAEESEEDGNGGIRAQRTRFNHLSRPSPYALVPWRRKGRAKGHERSYLSSGQANTMSDKTSQISTVASNDSSLSCSPFNLSVRASSKLHRLESNSAQGTQHHTLVPTYSRYRLGDEESHYNVSGEPHNKERPLKQTRFKCRIEKTKDFAQPPPPPANPIPDKKRLPALRQTTGHGSAGRQHRAHHPTNASVRVRTDKVDAMRRVRLITISPTSKHAHTLRPSYVVSNI